ncbi:intraflagellar transport protein 74 homolog [Lingula anatina]|uniref:Intraflagellar transport protein 74 homolog n=1 Tax=Lingula anatina TaxID=7574 RepID=A0A1S3JDI7_LINAN|nr:intraflagellar transport protein 74 homolog [Lingula anatina]|eukprot:XP_013407954.1 intraflagellar transport protein 74 homolog [Lingula anatina]
MNRPPSSSGRPTTASRGGPKIGAPAPVGRPPGTATRLTTGMVPGTGRPGTRGGVQGGGAALAAPINVTDRPMTQQGLGGIKTGGRGPHRQVQDRSYFLGQLRTKHNELNQECNKLRKDIEQANEEQSSFLTYEKRAEQLAGDLGKLQGELGDYNTLVDKLNTDEDIGDIQRDYEELQAQNEREAKNIDAIFTQKQEQENHIRQLEQELDQEKRMADNLVADMNPEMRQRYMQLKQENDQLLMDLEKGQQELDALNTKKTNLEEELSLSQVKQEAVQLYEKLFELEQKRDQLMEEAQAKGSPAEEREKLLNQVKQDNQEISSMERHCNEIHEKVNQLQEELRQLDMDLEENMGERNQKYRELKKREETMNEFLDTFDESKTQEIERISQLEANVVAILEHMSRNLSRFSHLPTPKELANMKDDLAFKETEMKKSEATATTLAQEREKYQVDLQKVEQLETKINSELEMLKNKIETMNSELEIYGDIPKLKAQAEEKKKKLAEDKITLQKRRDTIKQLVQDLSADYESLKVQLGDNETFAQLGNLERKWQHHEQNNFVMKEFIAAKTMECDYRPIMKTVSTLVADYNQLLMDHLSGKSSVG